MVHASGGPSVERAADVRGAVNPIPIEHAADSVAIEYETYERVIRIVALGAPPAALAEARWSSSGVMSSMPITS